MVRISKKIKGQSLVETALILPLIILILFAIIEFGRVFNAFLVITSASREGARVAAVTTNDAEVIQAVNGTAAAIDIAAIRITITPSGAYRTQGEQVTVEVAYEADIITPVISSIVPDPFKLISRSVMRIE